MVKELPFDLFPININYQISRLGPNRVSVSHALHHGIILPDTMTLGQITGFFGPGLSHATSGTAVSAEGQYHVLTHHRNGIGQLPQSVTKPELGSGLRVKTGKITRQWDKELI